MLFEKKNNTIPVSENSDFLVLEDDELMLLEDDEVLHCTDRLPPDSSLREPWKMTIVDDDPAVHQATKLAFKNFVFEGRPLSLLHGFSGSEAQQLIAEHPDTAVMLLDVVMESNDAGLKVVRYIRDELQNKQVQIILRTGQPGDVPEESVIRNYEINDYKLKVELTRQRLITTAIAALRAYRNAIAVEEKTAALTQALQTLQQTQLQLVQYEKMSALGNLVAGVAHEINNPLGCISGNLVHATDYIQDLLSLLELYQQHYPDPVTDIQEEIEAIDLEYLTQDLPQMVNSMKMGAERIRNISTSLRMFSRADSDRPIPFKLREGLDSTLLILKHRLKGKENRPAIEVIKEYGITSAVQCYPGQLNQVFTNLIANAIDAFDENPPEGNEDPCQIRIQTLQEDAVAIIRIADNGKGMPEAVRERIFEPGFTTKGVGKGTGLGMAIARQIVEDKHRGTLTCMSQLGRGTVFEIRLPLGES